MPSVKRVRRHGAREWSKLTWNVSLSMPSYIEQMLVTKRMSAAAQPAATILLAWRYNLDKHQKHEPSDVDIEPRERLPENSEELCR